MVRALRERKHERESHYECKVSCLDVGSMFVMLGSRLNSEYLVYHRLEPIP